VEAAIPEGLYRTHVNETFEKLLNLRSDVEKALEQLAKSAAPLRRPRCKSAAPATTTKAPAKPPSCRKTRGAGNRSWRRLRKLLEQIWEQLIATPPTRGRSMTTVKIGRARILMSSWEVTAFVNEDVPPRRLAPRGGGRAMITPPPRPRRKPATHRTDRALSVARVEVSRLQERVDVASRQGSERRKFGHQHKAFAFCFRRS